MRAYADNASPARATTTDAAHRILVPVSDERTKVADAAELIRAIADLVGAVAWPLIVAALLVAYKSEVVGVLRRLRRFRFPGGGEAELDPDLDQLEKQASAVANTSPAVPLAEAAMERNLRITGEPSRSEDARLIDPVQSILEEAARSPRVGLIALSGEIERKVRELLGTRGQLPVTYDRRQPWLVQNLRQLDVSDDMLQAVEQFQAVRNKIIHGRQASDREAVRAVDSGVKILAALESIPHETHVVREPRLKLYQDAQGALPLENVHGVMLESISSVDPSLRRVQVYPTTRTHFETGRRVAMEWNHDLVYHQAYYCDPSDREIKPAWGSSMEFIGRHLEDV